MERGETLHLPHAVGKGASANRIGYLRRVPSVWCCSLAAGAGKWNPYCHISLLVLVFQPILQSGSRSTAEPGCAAMGNRARCLDTIRANLSPPRSIASHRVRPANTHSLPRGDARVSLLAITEVRWISRAFSLPFMVGDCRCCLWRLSSKSDSRDRRQAMDGCPATLAFVKSFSHPYNERHERVDSLFAFGCCRDRCCRLVTGGRTVL